MVRNYLFTIREFWGRWAIDIAGEERGAYRLKELLAMFRAGDIGGKTWLRSIRTRRYSLVAETLYEHELISDAEFEQLVPRGGRRETSETVRI